MIIPIIFKGEKRPIDLSLRMNPVHTRVFTTPNKMVDAFVRKFSVLVKKKERNQKPGYEVHTLYLWGGSMPHVRRVWFRGVTYFLSNDFIHLLLFNWGVEQIMMLR